MTRDPEKEILALLVALGMATERLEAASAERPPSQDREVLIEDDNHAVRIGRELIQYHWERRHPNVR